MNKGEGMIVKVKCQWCQNKDEKETMTSEQIGKQNRYYHPNCYDQYLIDKEFKQQERLELDSLVDVIKRVHDIKIIPNQFYPYLQQLRNDDVLFGKLKKQYKQGVSYKVITDTYEYCQKDIAWAKGNKDFKQVMAELKYGLAIVKNNIENMTREKHKRIALEEKEKELKKQGETFKQIQERVKQSQAKKEDEDKVDLTTLLD